MYTLISTAEWPQRFLRSLKFNEGQPPIGLEC